MIPGTVLVEELGLEGSTSRTVGPTRVPSSPPLARYLVPGTRCALVEGPYLV